MKTGRFAPDETARLIDLSIGGTSVREIATKMDRDYQAVAKKRAQLGLGRARLALLDCIQEQIRTMRSDGGSFLEIAAVTGYSPPTVRRWCAEMGLPIDRLNRGRRPGREVLR